MSNYQGGGTHIRMLCTPIFVRGQNNRKSKGQLYSVQSMIKLLYLFDVLGQISQSQNKFQQYYPHSSDQCNDTLKKFSVKILTADED